MKKQGGEPGTGPCAVRPLIMRKLPNFKPLYEFLRAFVPSWWILFRFVRVRKNLPIIML